MSQVRILSPQPPIGVSSNGRASVSKTDNLGSIPSTSAILGARSSAVEQRPFKSLVAGSNPAALSILPRRLKVGLRTLNALIGVRIAAREPSFLLIEL